MSGKPSIDQELERLLAGEETELSALYRRLPAAEPDEKLDASVLAMAHRAVNPHLAATSRVDRRAPARPRPWMFALGSAAGVVLAAGVAWQLRSTIQQSGDEALQRASEPASEGVIVVTPKERASRPDSAAPPAAPPAAAAPALAVPPPPQAPAAATSAASKPPQGDDAFRSQAELERLKKSADEKPKATSPEEEALSAAHSRREEHGVTEYTLPAGAAGPAPRPTPFPAEPLKQSNAAVDKQEDRVKSDREQNEKLETISVTGSRIRRADLETASPTLSIERDSVERKAAMATGASHAEEPVPKSQPKDAAAAKAIQAAPAGAAPSRSAVLQNNARLSPQAWVSLMQQLLRDGRREEARENLDLFRRKYSDYKLPDELKALIDSP